ncbi:hypothetical protein IAR55_006741 [Kwoniella newhampshirensis]|uniref:Uncharacterized protein n=1 Tax=Kwoniella newhampshirensis TaxID=1651941 RepID=A0AAW0YTG6_9TREE
MDIHTTTDEGRALVAQLLVAFDSALLGPANGQSKDEWDATTQQIDRLGGLSEHWDRRLESSFMSTRRISGNLSASQPPRFNSKEVYDQMKLTGSSRRDFPQPGTAAATQSLTRNASHPGFSSHGHVGPSGFQGVGSPSSNAQLSHDAGGQFSQALGHSSSQLAYGACVYPVQGSATASPQCFRYPPGRPVQNIQNVFSNPPPPYQSPNSLYGWRLQHTPGISSRLREELTITQSSQQPSQSSQGRWEYDMDGRLTYSIIL